MTKEEAYELIETALHVTGLKWEREYRFHPSRRWRFDYAIPGSKIAIEYEGGVFARGRHVRGVGYSKDCEKYNEAAKLGWVVLRYTSANLEKGGIMDDLECIKNPPPITA